MGISTWFSGLFGGRAAPPSVPLFAAAGSSGESAFIPQPQSSSPPRAAPDRPHIRILTKSSRTDYASTHYGYGLTPEQLFAYIRQADAGQPMAMLDTLESLLLNDGHAVGLFNKRLDSVVVQDTQWSAPNHDSSSNTAEFAAMWDRHMRTTNIAQAVEHVALADYLGWSYLEVAWQTMPGGWQMPAYFVPVPHRRFMFDATTFEPLLTSDAFPKGERLVCTAGSSWVLAQSNRFRKPTFSGRNRQAAPWMLFKRMSVRDWVIFAQKYGIPLMLGTYAENSGEATRRALVEALDRLQEEGNVVLEEGNKIEVSAEQMRMGTSNHLHGGLVAMFNSEISKIFTGGTLTAEAGGSGSYALGNVHAEGEHKMSLADAARIQIAFSQLAAEAVVRNGLVGKVSPPEMYLAVQPDFKAMDAESRVVVNLSKAGLPLSIKANRRRFNQPAPSGTEDEMKPIEATKKEEQNGAADSEAADAAA